MTDEERKTEERIRDLIRIAGEELGSALVRTRVRARSKYEGDYNEAHGIQSFVRAIDIWRAAHDRTVTIMRMARTSEERARALGLTPEKYQEILDNAEAEMRRTREVMELGNEVSG